jgi:hypothetical protein
MASNFDYSFVPTMFSALLAHVSADREAMEYGVVRHHLSWSLLLHTTGQRCFRPIRENRRGALTVDVGYSDFPCLGTTGTSLHYTAED